jgi:hypothetical protein
MQNEAPQRVKPASQATNTKCEYGLLKGGEDVLNEHVGDPGKTLAPAVPGHSGVELAGYGHVAGELTTCTENQRKFAAKRYDGLTAV